MSGTLRKESRIADLNREKESRGFRKRSEVIMSCMVPDNLPIHTLTVGHPTYVGFVSFTRSVLKCTGKVPVDCSFPFRMLTVSSTQLHPSQTLLSRLSFSLRVRASRSYSKVPQNRSHSPTSFVMNITRSPYHQSLSTILKQRHFLQESFHFLTKFL